MGRKKYTTKKFIELAEDIFGKTYDYSQVDYVDIHTKIKIICPKHGIFEIVPDLHVNKEVGCKYCGFAKAAESRKIGFEQFKRRANKIHKNAYKYVEEDYLDTQHKTTIICHIHGKFKQKASNHLDGFGCKKCSFSKKN